VESSSDLPDSRAEVVRKHLDGMQDVPSKRPVLIVVSLAGIKVCCPQGQIVYSSHALRRISYATCEPSHKLVAFLSREPRSPPHLQHCHAFRASSPEAAEEINGLIGNAFRMSYAMQVSGGGTEGNGAGVLPNGNSRSVESLLDDATAVGGLYANLDLDVTLHPPQVDGIAFSRLGQDRRSDNTFDRRAATQMRMARNGGGRYSHRTSGATNHRRSAAVELPPESDIGPQPSLPVTSSIPVKPRLPMRNPAPITSAEPSCRTAAFLNAASTSSSKGSQMQTCSKPEKPNSLPVLNCLFAALNKQRGQAESDDTSPYTLNQPKVPDIMHLNTISTSKSFVHCPPGYDQFNLDPQRTTVTKGGYRGGQGGGLATSYTQDDFRMLSIQPQTPTPPNSQSTSGFGSSSGGGPASGSSGSGGPYCLNESSLSESSGSDSLPPAATAAAPTKSSSRQRRSNHSRQHGGVDNIRTSKSAHIISGAPLPDVYSEVADAAGVGTPGSGLGDTSTDSGVIDLQSCSNRFPQAQTSRRDDLAKLRKSGWSMDEQLNGGHFYANEVIITPNSHGGGSNGGTEDIYEYPSYPLQNNHHPAANRPFPRSVSTTLAQNCMTTLAADDHHPLVVGGGEQVDTLDIEEIKNAPWFKEDMSRDTALETLRGDPEGSFVVRSSGSRSGRLALSVRVPTHFNPSGMVHYLIVRAPKGFRIKGCYKQFISLSSLLIHHSVMPEMLPCPLALTRHQAQAVFSQSNSAGSKAGSNVGSTSENAPDYEDASDYLDPSNDADYQLISQLREGLGNGFTNAKNSVNGTDCAEEIDTIQPYNSVAAVEIKAPPNGRILTSGNRRVQQR